MQTAFRSEQRFTQEQFRRWLDELPASDINHYELIRGHIVMSPPAGWVHGGVGSTLGRRLGQHVHDRALGYTFDASTGYELPSGDTLEPDFSFVSKARMAAGPKLNPKGFLRVVPDLAVETLSPSTAHRDRTEKAEIYAANGVDEYWIVDPRRRTVTVLDRDGSRFTTERVFTNEPIVSRVLPDLALDVEAVFADLPPA